MTKTERVCLMLQALKAASPESEGTAVSVSSILILPLTLPRTAYISSQYLNLIGFPVPQADLDNIK